MKADTQIIEKIKNKYKNHSLRKMIKFYESGVPEKYWDDGDHQLKELIESIAININDNNNVALIGNRFICNRIISNLNKYFICENKIIRQYEYLQLMSQLQDKYQQINLDIITETNNVDIVSVYNLGAGIMNDKFFNLFNTLVNSWLNSLMNKIVILGIEFDGDLNIDSVKESFVNKYGDLVEILNDNFTIIKV